MFLGLEFPPISHVVEWPTGPLGINKVIVLMWLSTLIAIGVMWLGGRKKSLVPTGIQNVAESAVDFVEDARFTRGDFGTWVVSYPYTAYGPRWRLEESGGAR